MAIFHYYFSGKYLSKLVEFFPKKNSTILCDFGKSKKKRMTYFESIALIPFFHGTSKNRVYSKAKLAILIFKIWYGTFYENF